MATKSLLAALAALIALSAAASLAEARQVKKLKPQDQAVARDCHPFNGPFGYYGNPWCDGGYKFAEDYAPGTGPNYDLLQLPQLRRYRYWWE